MRRNVGETAAPASPARRSRFGHYALFRLLLVPAQLGFVLVLLYLVLYEPESLASTPGAAFSGFFPGLAQMVVSDFTGNWGTSSFLQYPGVPMFQLYALLLPNSIELGAFALGIAAGIAYPVSLVAGWTRRSWVDGLARYTSLVGLLIPVMVVGSLVVSALFFAFLTTFNDVPDQGVIPSLPWWESYYGGYPDWVVYRSVTQPTGLALVDGLLHGAWTFEMIALIKTLLQAGVIAIVYVTIFLRHSRAVVADARDELHLMAARSRGVPERTLLWKHTARRVRPTFLLLFALTFPAYLGTQFVVEAVFLDRGIGYVALLVLTGQGGGGIQGLQVVMFLLAIIVLVWIFAVDVIARRTDPREVVGG